MRKFGFLLVMFVLFFACSEETKKEELIVDTVSSFEVTGMVCEMGCGGSIRKALKQTGAVHRVEVDFEEENPSNVIKVYYGSASINQDEIISAIEAINEGQFKATFIESAPHIEKENKQAYINSSKNSEITVFSAEESYFSLPNLSEILNGLIY